MMGRYSKNGTRFQELPGGTAGTASKLVHLEANGDRDACTATAFSDYELHLSFEQGEYWTPLEDTPYLENLGMLLDRKGEYLWSYSIVHPLEGGTLHGSQPMT